MGRAWYVVGLCLAGCSGAMDLPIEPPAETPPVKDGGADVVDVDVVVPDAGADVVEDVSSHPLPPRDAGCPEPERGVLHVSPLGSDRGNGSRACPFKTIAHAVSKAPKRIEIARGT